MECFIYAEGLKKFSTEKSVIKMVKILIHYWPTKNQAAIYSVPTALD